MGFYGARACGGQNMEDVVDLFYKADKEFDMLQALRDV